MNERSMWTLSSKTILDKSSLEPKCQRLSLFRFKMLNYIRIWNQAWYYVFTENIPTATVISGLSSNL